MELLVCSMSISIFVWKILKLQALNEMFDSETDECANQLIIQVGLSWS